MDARYFGASPFLDEWTQQVHQLLRRSLLIEVRRVEQEMEPQESKHYCDDRLRVGIGPDLSALNAIQGSRVHVLDPSDVVRDRHF